MRNKAPHPPAISITMAVCRCNTKHIAQCNMPRATSATGRRHRATTHYILAQWPPGRQSTKRRCKTQLFCWPFWWPLQCAGKIPRASPDGGGSCLSKKPLNATIGRALASIGINQTCQCQLILTFHREKGLELTCWPLKEWHTKLIRRT
jgi:hypothetical protein